ncbi:MAG: hypothetical protein ACD_40C00193G0001 [uncultured bacterium]|nr:MAG: hypothetical protein ACD_40C00193G0001 [uncultured bacterium]KKU15389.1 MAG: hypothetical protein UX21_C0003G0010 [Microgenomates group bacterium GW2011_GWC2_45_8]KKU26213.1 MAG: hypothetical protein UX37_C0004G0008 [Microgenomates group bacterium GW2011_GWA2_46_16]
MSKIKILLLLTLATIIAYGASLKYGFSQDDWFHLTISQARNVGEFLNFFNPAGVSWIFFRPLSTQLPYWIATSFFGLAIAPYFLHTLMLLIHVLNSYLVIKISRKYLHQHLPILLGFFYVISNIHFLSLFYIGAIQELISTFFSLLTIFLFLRARRTSQITLAVLTVCALLSKELALRLPLILLFLAYLRERNLLRTLKAVSGPLLVTAAYLVLRLVIHTGGALEYSLVLSPATALATTMWYGLFALGFPEYLLRFGLSGGLIDFVGFTRDTGWISLPIFLSATIFGFAILRQLFRRHSTHSLPILGLLCLLPVIFLPTHRYPHYLDLSILFFGIWLLKPLKKLNFIVIIFSLFVAVGVLASIAIEKKTHWTIKRAIIAGKVEQQLLSKPCQDLKNLIFLGPTPEPLEVSYAMSVEDGPRIICQNSDLRVYYTSDQVAVDQDTQIIKTGDLFP